MYKKNFVLFFLFLLLMGGTSCRSSKNVLYLQNAAANEKMITDAEYNARISSDDLLSIIVSCEDEEAALPFNTPMIGLSSSASGQTKATSGYLVDKAGYIDFPVLGRILVKGMTRSELSDYFVKELSQYLKSPIVTIQFLNFRITVLGEVRSPGNYPVLSERVTILDALGMAGDMNVNAKRKNILVVRDNGNEKEFARLDITSTEIFNSPYFYLKQNDVVYIEPTRGRIFQGDAGTYLPYLLSIVSTLFAILAFIK